MSSSSDGPKPHVDAAISCGLKRGVSVQKDSPRQRLSKLHHHAPGVDRVRQRASLLEKEREASRLLQLSLRANKTGNLGTTGEAQEFEAQHASRTDTSSWKQAEYVRNYMDALTEERARREEVAPVVCVCVGASLICIAVGRTWSAANVAHARTIGGPRLAVLMIVMMVLLRLNRIHTRFSIFGY